MIDRVTIDPAFCNNGLSIAKDRLSIATDYYATMDIAQ